MKQSHIILVLIVGGILAVYLSSIYNRRIPTLTSPVTNTDSVLNAIKERYVKDSINKSVNQKKILKKLRRNYDDMNDISWYYDKSTSKYTDTKFYIYFGIDKNGDITPRVVLSYLADDWLFINSIIIKTGKYTFTVYESSRDGIQDVMEDSGDIYEQIDVVLDKNWKTIFEAISKSNTLKVRYVGNDYYKDLVISKRERDALVRMYTYYNQLK